MPWNRNVIVLSAGLYSQVAHKINWESLLNSLEVLSEKTSKNHAKYHDGVIHLAKNCYVMIIHVDVMETVEQPKSNKSPCGYKTHPEMCMLDSFNWTVICDFYPCPNKNHFLGCDFTKYDIFWVNCFFTTVQICYTVTWKSVISIFQFQFQYWYFRFPQITSNQRIA